MHSFSEFNVISSCSKMPLNFESGRNILNITFNVNVDKLFDNTSDCLCG